MQSNIRKIQSSVRALMTFCVFATILSATSSSAHAQTQIYPVKTIRFVVPSSPGAPPDVFGRKVAEGMAPKLGATIIIDNKPGASGLLGTTEVAKAPPDGYTVLVANRDPLTSSIAILKTAPPYDPLKDFTFVTKLVKGGPALVAHPSYKPSTLQEIIASTKASGPIDYATFGIGSFPHYTMEALAQRTGAQFRPVHYRSVPQAVQAVIQNEVTLGFADPKLTAPMITEGKLKAIAVLGDNRAAALPAIPTFVEAGMDGFIFRDLNWIGIVVPAGTPRQIVDKLADAARATMAEAAMRSYFSDFGLEVVADKPDDFEKDFKIQHAEIAKIIKELGITAE